MASEGGKSIAYFGRHILDKLRSRYERYEFEAFKNAF